MPGGHDRGVGMLVVGLDAAADLSNFECAVVRLAPDALHLLECRDRTQVSAQSPGATFSLAALPDHLIGTCPNRRSGSG